MSDNDGGSSGLELPAAIRRSFRDHVALVDPGHPRARSGAAADMVNIEWLEAPRREPKDLRRGTLPRLVVPDGVATAAEVAPSRVVIALEGKDKGMASEVVRLLDPARVYLELIHVTWLPGIVSASFPREGLDNPSATDLLLFEGATEALVDAANTLLRAGFDISTHLRMEKHPAVALADYLSGSSVDLVVLGLGRHGAGIGHDLQREIPVPILYVDARP